MIALAYRALIARAQAAGYEHLIYGAPVHRGGNGIQHAWRRGQARVYWLPGQLEMLTGPTGVRLVLCGETPDPVLVAELAEALGLLPRETRALAGPLAELQAEVDKLAAGIRAAACTCDWYDGRHLVDCPARYAARLAYHAEVTR